MSEADRLKPDAPRAKVVAYLEQLRTTGEQIAAMPLGTPKELDEAGELNQKLHQRTFQAFSRAFDGLELRRQLNRTHDMAHLSFESEASKLQRCLEERMRILDEALRIARRID